MHGQNGNYRKIVVIPDFLQSEKSYGNYSRLQIWKREDKFEGADIIIADRFGATRILRDSLTRIKHILVNPYLRKRSNPAFFWRCVKFLLSKKMDREEIKNLRCALKELRSLLQCDVLPLLDSIPRENVVVVRGTENNYFCGDKTAALLEKRRIKVVEVKGSGCRWDDNIAQAVHKLISEGW
jgi:hypothetical protein